MSDKTVYSRRNPAIDMLRALTMFTMIFVNDFWKVHDVPHWLEHAVYGEDFMGLADIVFPCFLFAVGMSIPYAIERRYAKGFSAESTLGHILSRTFALLVMGAFITNSEFRLSPEAPYPIGVYWFLMAIGFIGVWNQYPKPASGTQKNLFRAFKIIGVLVLLYLAFTFRNPQEGVFGAYWGILGSIGWTYLVCAVIYFFSRDRLKYLLPIWGVFILICLLGTPLRESFGGEAILTFPERNFYQGMLGILHIGNGALPAFTMGGIILSILSARYADKGVILTDDLVEYPNTPNSISESDVDYVVEVDSVGDSSKIASGAIRDTKNPRDILLAQQAAKVFIYFSWQNILCLKFRE